MWSGGKPLAVTLNPFHQIIGIFVEAADAECVAGHESGGQASHRYRKPDGASERMCRDRDFLDIGSHFLQGIESAQHGGVNVGLGPLRSEALLDDADSQSDDAVLEAVQI